MSEINSIQGLKSWLQDAMRQIERLERDLSESGGADKEVQKMQEHLFALRASCDDIAIQLDSPRGIKATLNTKPLRNQIDMVAKAMRTSPLLQRYFAEQHAGFFWQVIFGLNGYLDAFERAALQPPQYRVERVSGGELPPQS